MFSCLQLVVQTGNGLLLELLEDMRLDAPGGAHLEVVQAGLQEEEQRPHGALLRAAASQQGAGGHSLAAGGNAVIAVI